MPNTPIQQATPKGEAGRKFVQAIKQILSVPKGELAKREAAYQQERAAKKAKRQRAIKQACLYLIAAVTLLLARAALAGAVSEIGEDIRVGEMEYHVFGVQWIEQLSGDYPGNYRSQFLIVDMAVRNKDQEPRTIPPLYLYDENAAKYEQSANRFSLETGRTKFKVAPFPLLHRLNPGAGARGLAVFQVPKIHGYLMQLPSAWTHSDASPRFVKLMSVPTPALPKGEKSMVGMSNAEAVADFDKWMEKTFPNAPKRTPIPTPKR